ncbi:MAG: hypothetical protein GY906_22605 [bacterium]|nr:hypothetical protein [bacterium]
MKATYRIDYDPPEGGMAADDPLNGTTYDSLEAARAAIQGLLGADIAPWSGPDPSEPGWRTLEAYCEDQASRDDGGTPGDYYIWESLT